MAPNQLASKPRRLPGPVLSNLRLATKMNPKFRSFRSSRGSPERWGFVQASSALVPRFDCSNANGHASGSALTGVPSPRVLRTVPLGLDHIGPGVDPPQKRSHPESVLFRLVRAGWVPVTGGRVRAVRWTRELTGL